jgi:hypothetical protein
MFLLSAMKQKTTLLVLGLTLTIAVALAIAPILSEIAYASADPTNHVCGNSGAAVNNPHCNGGQIHVHVCSNPGAAENNPHCN